jgi:hypothetical protein
VYGSSLCWIRIIIGHYKSQNQQRNMLWLKPCVNVWKPLRSLWTWSEVKSFTLAKNWSAVFLSRMKLCICVRNGALFAMPCCTSIICCKWIHLNG